MYGALGSWFELVLKAASTGAARMAAALPVQPYSCAVVYKMPFKIPLKSAGQAAVTSLAVFPPAHAPA